MTTQRYYPQYSVNEDLYDDVFEESSEESGKPRIIEIDEVDSGQPVDAPQSPVVSEGAHNIPQATYVVLSSFDIIELTVTPAAVGVLTDVVQVCIH